MVCIYEESICRFIGVHLGGILFGRQETRSMRTWLTYRFRMIDALSIHSSHASAMYLIKYLRQNGGIAGIVINHYGDVIGIMGMKRVLAMRKGVWGRKVKTVCVRGFRFRELERRYYVRSPKLIEMLKRQILHTSQNFGNLMQQFLHGHGHLLGLRVKLSLTTSISQNGTSNNYLNPLVEALICVDLHLLYLKPRSLPLNTSYKHPLKTM